MEWPDGRHCRTASTVSGACSAGRTPAGPRKIGSRGRAGAPAGAAAPAADPIAQLKELGELHESGVLTDEEFAAQKAKLLG